jgi:two-component system KDP operon response regulator KdpE
VLNAGGGTILIVDDEPVVRALLRAALEPVASRLLESADGEDAIELSWQERPELIVLDVGLPLLSGIDVCRALKTHLPPPRVLLVTGNRYVDGIDACGADAIFVKPFDPLALREEALRLLALPAAA